MQIYHVCFYICAFKYERVNVFVGLDPLILAYFNTKKLVYQKQLNPLLTNSVSTI